MAGGGDSGQARLAELVAALSLGIDLGFGQPMEHVLRQCLIAGRLAERIGLDDAARADVYYTALLINVGCHTDAHEQAKWFGDDIALRSGKYGHELGSARSTAAVMRLLGSGRPPLHRFRIGLEFAVSGHRDLDGMVAHHAAMARSLAAELELPEGVLEALDAAYEQWDGRGWPGELKGDEIPIAARLAQIAEFVEVAHRVGGVEGARELARRRGGKQFDPALARIMRADADLLLAGLDAIAHLGCRDQRRAGVYGSSSRVSASMRHSWQSRPSSTSNRRTHWVTHGPSPTSPRRPGLSSALSGDDVIRLYRAGLVHDFGRLGVSNAIWDKRGPLGTGEWERVRTHPYLTERMLKQSDALAPYGAIAAQHRERLNGTGYPRGLVGAAISPVGPDLGRRRRLSGHA